MALEKRQTDATHRFKTAGTSRLCFRMTERMALFTSTLVGEVNRRMAEFRLDKVSREESSDTSDKSSSMTGNSVLMDCCRDSESLKENGHDIFTGQGFAHAEERITK